jgi:hypothetical protein
MLDADGTAQPGKQEYVVVDATADLESPEVIETSSGYLVVYESCIGPDCEDSTDRSVEARALDIGGKPTGSVQIVSPPVAVQRRPYLTSAFGKTFVTYRDVDGGNVVIQLHALTDEGAVDATPNGVTVEVTDDVLYPGLAANASHIALSYAEGDASSSVKLHLYDADLNLVEDVTVRELGERATNTVVGWTGSAWIVAWEDYAGATEVVHAAAVSANGGSVSTPVDVSQGNGNWPSLTGNGVDGLLGYYGVDVGGRVMLARIASSGEVLEQNVVISNPETQDARLQSIAYNSSRDEIGMVYSDNASSEVFFARAKCPLEDGAGGAAGAGN